VDLDQLSYAEHSPKQGSGFVAIADVDALVAAQSDIDIMQP